MCIFREMLTVSVFLYCTLDKVWNWLCFSGQSSWTLKNGPGDLQGVLGVHGGGLNLYCLCTRGWEGVCPVFCPQPSWGQWEALALCTGIRGSLPWPLSPPPLQD